MRMYNESKYQRIVSLYGRIIEEFKGYAPEDQRMLDSEPLAIKLFFHAATAYWLASGTNLEPLLGRPGVIFDHASVKVLARAALESYLTFHYIFVDSKSDDEFNFRYLVWQLSGFAQRERFPVQLPEHRAQQEQESQLNAQLRARIKETDQFRKLKPGQQKEVLKGRKWRFASWASIASSAGIGKDYSGFMYGLLSSYVHSDSLSALQISQAKSKEDQLDLLHSALDFIMAIVAKMIVVYTDRFPRAMKALESDPEATKLARIYAEALAKLK